MFRHRLVLWLLLIDLVDVTLSFAFEGRSLLPALTRCVQFRCTSCTFH